MLTFNHRYTFSLSLSPSLSRIGLLLDVTLCGLLANACERSSRWSPWQPGPTHPTRHSHSVKHPFLSDKLEMRVHTHTQGLFFVFFYSMQTQTRTHTRTLKGFPGCRGVLFLGCIFFFFFAFGHFSLPPLHQKTQVNFFLRRSDISCSNLPQRRYRKLYEYCVHSLTHLNFSLLFFFFFFFLTSCHLLYNSPLPLVGRKPVICTQNLHSRGPLTVNGR